MMVRALLAMLAMLAGCVLLAGQTTTRSYSFPNPIQLVCCSPLEYGFTNVINDSTITGQNLQVASLSITATASVGVVDPYGVVGFDWIVAVSPQPFGYPAGEATGGNPQAVMFTAPTQLHTAEQTQTSAGSTVTFSTKDDFRTGTFSTLPSGHVVASSVPVMNLTAGLYLQLFAWTGDTNAQLTLSNIQVVVILAPPPVPSSNTIQASPNPVTFGHPLTLSSMISPPDATGTVTFYDGISIIGVAPVSKGQATLATTLLAPSIHAISAAYHGDVSHQRSSSNMISQTVSALPQDSFQPTITYAANSPLGVVVGDFNGDGLADLAVSDFFTNNLSILLGNGDGTFRAAIQYLANSYPGPMAVGDFNGDGYADLAVIPGIGGNNVNILLGNGDGTFKPPVYNFTSLYPTAIAVGDFNGDGLADLAVSNLVGKVSVLLAQGDGMMRPAVNYPVGSQPGSIAIGDFNGDGRLDIVVSYGETGPTGLSFLFGNGDGTFQPAVNRAGLGGIKAGLLVGDFNGDGRADLVVANTLMVGNGDGTFHTGATLGLTPSIAADVNGDGRVDLLGVTNLTDLSTNFTTGNFGVLLGNGDGTFQTTPITYNPNIYLPISLAIGDFNGDGRVDVALVDQNLPSPGGVSVMLGIPASTVPSVFGLAIEPGGVLNAGSFAKNAKGLGTAVAPGSLVQIYGTFPGATAAGPSTAPFLTTLGNASVSFNGVAAPLSSVSPAGQYPFINAQVPFEALPAGQSSATVNVVVSTALGNSETQQVQIVPAAPGIFTIPPNGTGNAVLVFTDPADDTVKIAAPAGAAGGYPAAPIPRGQPGFFYVTGLGAMSPPVPDGDAGASPAIAHYANATPIVTVGGLAAQVPFAGQAAGFPGVNQINIVVPLNAPVGNQVPIQVTSADGSFVSNMATISIR